MSYLDQLTSVNSDVLLDTSDAWYQFVSDHRMYLRSIAPRITPSADDMTQLQFDLHWFLRTNDRKASIAWIVALINGINDIDFTESMTLFVPTMSQIKALYGLYNTAQTVYLQASS